MGFMAKVRTKRQYRQDLEAEPHTLARVRRIVTGCLWSWGYGGLVDPVVLCLAELLANVGKHAGSPACAVALEDVGGGVRLTVSDASAQVPVVREVDWFAESGRGMFIVCRTASAWGADVTATGKDVWARFDADEGGFPAGAAGGAG